MPGNVESWSSKHHRFRKGTPSGPDRPVERGKHMSSKMVLEGYSGFLLDLVYSPIVKRGFTCPGFQELRFPVDQ